MSKAEERVRAMATFEERLEYLLKGLNASGLKFALVVGMPSGLQLHSNLPDADVRRDLRWVADNQKLTEKSDDPSDSTS